MENFNLFLASIEKLESLSDSFLNLISDIEVKKKREVGPQDIDSLDINQLFDILQFFLGLSSFNNFVQENSTSPKILPIWERLIKIYKAIPVSFIRNFGGENFLIEQQDLLDRKSKELILLN